jgi:hypothetical protein
MGAVIARVMADHCFPSRRHGFTAGAPLTSLRLYSVTPPACAACAQIRLELSEGITNHQVLCVSQHVTTLSPLPSTFITSHGMPCPIAEPPALRGVLSLSTAGRRLSTAGDTLAAAHMHMLAATRSQQPTRTRSQPHACSRGHARSSSSAQPGDMLAAASTIYAHSATTCTPPSLTARDKLRLCSEDLC